MTAEGRSLRSALAARDWLSQAACAVVRLAEDALGRGGSGDADAGLWREYLERTGRSGYLRALPDREWRYRWAETAFAAIRSSRYTLAEMIRERVRRNGERVLFRSADRAAPRWTYGAVERRLRSLAGLFLSSAAGEPRVAILAENSIESACCDLACLSYGIFVVPLNVHFDASTLTWIFDRLGITAVVTDTDERQEMLERLRPDTRVSFRIFRTQLPARGSGTETLDAACLALDIGEADRLLNARPAPDIDAAATAMFTSGSTGRPKGVVFSHFNVISKRFARAAALPAVGADETLLCYLPLFHTFGRYLEMLGTIYWGGTYVLAGNPSVETLLSQMQQIRPTGLISIPLRWSQIRDAALERIGEREAGTQEDALRSIVGNRLRWGLSAAGFLDARVFRFFQRHGVDLCSGFGMTEATGGITMTPPGEYVDNSVGIPLPGARIRFGEAGELQVSGPYVARYLPEDSSGPELPAAEEEYWLETGDLFQLHENGHLEIVDRIKDIYKNSRGQTIAPRRVEQKFDDVPGVKRAFLVGDHRDYNVLLLVPNPGDVVLQAPADRTLAYFRHLVRAANEGLAPYERVVNFAVLERDFAEERDELTPKGSYKRRTIEEHFRPVIESLYESSYVLLQTGSLRIRIPRWFFRDLGALENDLVADEREIRHTEKGISMRLHREPGRNTARIGDLEYELAGDVVDLGLFARQPRLWAGNPQLFAFCPCKDGWDVPLAGVSPQVRLPWTREERMPDGVPDSRPIADAQLREIHTRCGEALLGLGASSLSAVRRLGELLRSTGVRYAPLIRRRLEALSRHAEEDVRCLAYRILLGDEPGSEYSESFPAFLESGLTFLTEESIREIAESDLRGPHLDALRQRLFRYRKGLTWPAEPVTREQFHRIFALLAAFAQGHPAGFGAVRAELAAWALHRADPDLARTARASLEQASRLYRGGLLERRSGAAGLVRDRILYEDGLDPLQAAAAARILEDPSFLTESVRLAFEESSFVPDEIASNGIWVSHVSSQHQVDLFRISINLREGKHFDLLVAAGDDLRNRPAHETSLWMMALSSLPYAPPAVPPFGAYRADLGALSVAYVSELTAWDRIRQFSGAQDARGAAPGNHDWQRLFTRGMAAFFRLWRLSGNRLVARIAPGNVVVPSADFRENSLVLSVAGAQPSAGPLEMVRAMLRNFYRQTAAHYPKSWKDLHTGWVVDAAIEGIPGDDGEAFLRELKRELGSTALAPEEKEIGAVLEAFLQRRPREYLPLALTCAIDRFVDWERINPNATRAAREEQTNQVFRLYRLDRYSHRIRYRLFRDTYFSCADDRVAEAFVRLLEVTGGGSERTAAELGRLSELQSSLTHPADREVFSRMVLPQANADYPVQIAAMGEGSGKHLVLHTRIVDSHGVEYDVREPVGVSEVGYTFRLLFEEGPPEYISERDRFFVALDDQERIVAAIRYRFEEAPMVSLEGIAVANALKGRRIGSSLLDDFCARVAAAGAGVVRTGFILRRFFAANGFRADARWGGLVKFLSANAN